MYTLNIARAIKKMTSNEIKDLVINELNFLKNIVAIS